MSPDHPVGRQGKQPKNLQLHNKNQKSTVREGIHEKAAQGFSLRSLDPAQMRELNEMLEQFVEVPRAQSMPRRKYIASPSMSPEHEEEFKFLLSEFYKGNRYTLDEEECEKWRN